MGAISDPDAGFDKLADNDVIEGEFTVEDSQDAPKIEHTDKEVK